MMERNTTCEALLKHFYAKDISMKFKKLNPNAVLPTQANHGDAGYDLCAVADGVYITPVALIPTGVAVEIPDNHVGLILDRSSMATKRNITHVAGVIDSSYRGQVHVALTDLTGVDIVVTAGDKIAQMVIVPCVMEPSEWVDELSDTQRGHAGFGSTGK